MPGRYLLDGGGVPGQGVTTLCLIRGKSYRTEIRNPFPLHLRVQCLSLWNSLPQKVVEASSLAIFKRALDVALVAKGIRGYGEKAGTGYWVGWSAMITLNGGAGSKGRLAYSCTYFSMFDNIFPMTWCPERMNTIPLNAVSMNTLITH